MVVVAGLTGCASSEDGTPVGSLADLGTDPWVTSYQVRPGNDWKDGWATVNVTFTFEADGGMVQVFDSPDYAETYSSVGWEVVCTASVPVEGVVNAVDCTTAEVDVSSLSGETTEYPAVSSDELTYTPSLRWGDQLQLGNFLLDPA